MHVHVCAVCGGAGVCAYGVCVMMRVVVVCVMMCVRCGVSVIVHVGVCVMYVEKIIK